MSFSARAIASTGLTNLVILAFNFASGVLQARMLGPAGRGELLDILVYPTLVAGLALGLTEQALVVTASRDPAKESNLVANALRASLLIIVVAIIAVVAATIGRHLNHVEAPLLVFVSIWSALTVLSRNLAALLWGRQEWTRYNLVRVSFYPIFVLGLVIAWLSGNKHVQTILWVHIAALLAYVCILLAFSPREYRHGRGSWTEVATLSRRGVGYLVSTGAWTLMFLADQVAAAELLDDVDKGNYAVAVRFVSVVVAAASAIGVVSLVDGSSAGERREASFYSRYRFLTMALLLLVLALTPLAWLGVPIIFGNAFEPARTPMLALMPGAYFFACSLVLERRFEGEGKTHFATAVRLFALGTFVASILIVQQTTPSILRLAMAFSAAQLVRYAASLGFEVVSSRCSLAALLLPRPREFYNGARRLLRTTVEAERAA